ncbi:MAG: prolipoprotein diacylglyceryl transferase, partial [Thermoguttaceae bacterium]|nr:prolipoprotein diacylglyceryl transferase [Thermoguttaceae bacterium]
RVAKRDGVVFAGLLILYPIHRFCIELLRTDEESFCGTGLTVSQCVSLATFVIGVAVLFYSLKGAPKRALDGYFPKEEENN